jgi:ribose transport system ATP-binding protein
MGGNTMIMLEMKGISKSFPGVRALDNVSFSATRGEVHALVGGNGAGKSTLMKILAGAQSPDEGEIYIRGQKATIADPEEARKLGIAIIYQELNLVPTLNTVENVFLGSELTTRKGVLDTPRMVSETKQLLASLELNIDITKPVGNLSVAQQQMIEIAKALHVNAEILVMDEPTASLTDHDIDVLFAIVERLKAKDVSIIYISHRLEEIYRICDRLTVLRDGQIIGTRNTDELTQHELIKMMINRDLNQVFPCSKCTPGQEALKVVNLNRKGVLKDINMHVCVGEVVGIAGLVGSGRTELVRAIFGADPIDSGEIYMDGKPVKIGSPNCAVKLGIGLVPEDRKEQGVILKLAVKENVTLASLPMKHKSGVIKEQNDRLLAQHLSEKLSIRCSDLNQMVGNLSGGNQQKVAVSKWLATESKVLIFDEPTRGIDVGAKTELYNFLRDLAAEGLAVIMVSSDLLEILGLSDRIYVMYNGAITGEVCGSTASHEKVMALAMGAGVK